VGGGGVGGVVESGSILYEGAGGEDFCPDCLVGGRRMRGGGLWRGVGGRLWFLLVRKVGRGELGASVLGERQEEKGETVDEPARCPQLWRGVLSVEGRVTWELGFWRYRNLFGGGKAPEKGQAVLPEEGKLRRGRDAGARSNKEPITSGEGSDELLTAESGEERETTVGAKCLARAPKYKTLVGKLGGEPTHHEPGGGGPVKKLLGHPRFKNFRFHWGSPAFSDS